MQKSLGVMFAAAESVGGDAIQQAYRGAGERNQPRSSRVVTARDCTETNVVFQIVPGG
jgi:hypothetical protein